jgi:hypothetical protein
MSDGNPQQGEILRLVPKPNAIWNDAITAAIQVLQKHLSPRHGVVIEVKKLLR